MWLENKALIGQFVELIPLAKTHIPALQALLKNSELSKLWYAKVPDENALPEYVEKAIKATGGGDIAYAVCLKATAQVVGCTRYYEVDEKNKRALIGYTWYAEEAQNTVVNTESKYLLLKNLFEHGAIAAEFRTHYFNQKSRSAIERLGAKQDGILRSHQIMPDGSLRDTVVYSIIASEWPAVRANLLSRLK